MALVPSQSNLAAQLLEEEDIPAGMPTTGPNLDLQLKIWAGIQVLWPFLCDPGNSPICAASVYKFMRGLISNPGDGKTKASVRILRTKHQQALDAMMHFVCIPRPAATLEELEASLNECKCDLTAPVLEMVHENHNSAPWAFKDMIASMFSVLGDVMENMKVGHIAGSHAAAARGQTEQGKWPSSTAAIFPRGPDQAIVSFIILYRLTKASSILDFIRFALPHCPSLAAPAVNSTDFWKALVEQLQRAVDNIEEDPRITGINRDYQHQDDPPPTHTIQSIVTMVQTLTVTFTGSLRQDIHSSALMLHARNIHDLLLKVLIRAKRSPSQMQLAEFCAVVTGIAMTVVTALPKTHPQRPRSLHPVLLEYAQIVRGGPASTVYTVIQRLTESVVECCSATCTVTSESSTQKLQYCSQCTVMRYCSGPCQKTAWKYHKLVCKDLKKLKQEVLPRSSRKTKWPVGQFIREFEKEALKQGFTIERIEELSAELGPFLHFQNAGMKSAPSHEKAKHC